MAHTAPGRVVGTLAFRALSGSPVVHDSGSQGDATPATLAAGQVMYYDGDKECSWEGTEEGFGLMFFAFKEPSPKDTTVAKQLVGLPSDLGG